MTQEIGKTVDILLAEDNPGDVMLIEEALDDSRIRNRLHVVSDGEDTVTSWSRGCMNEPKNCGRHTRS